MTANNSPRPIAGKDFPWNHVAGYFLRLDSFAPFTKIDGDAVGKPTFGAYGLVGGELPNPDVEPERRLLTLPIEHKSDYKSLFRANLDSGIKDASNELVLVYEHRKGILGGKRACLHVAAYPTGTWTTFFDAVSRYASQEFRWPQALFLYQPSNTSFFPAQANLFQP